MSSHINTIDDLLF